MVNTQEQIPFFDTPQREDDETARRHLWSKQFTAEELQRRAIAHIHNDMARAKSYIVQTSRSLSEIRGEIHDLRTRLEELERAEVSSEEQLDFWTRQLQTLPDDINLYSPEIICWVHETPLPF